jgi:uncharacterized protein YbjT (DUF2867 family)
MPSSEPGTPPKPGLVLVAGGTGGVGQLAVAMLIAAGYPVRVLARDGAKVRRLFGDIPEVVLGDIRNPASLGAATAGVSHILCATGTTAFPSPRWEVTPAGGSLQTWFKVFTDAEYRRTQAKNGPEAVDAIGVANLVAAAPRDLQRFVFVSSCGITRKGQFPFSVLNSFGVLDAKEKGEMAIAASGLPYTIIRPARLIDGPYTSTDLNTLLKAKTGGKLGVVLGQGDALVGESSRIDVAAACVACLEAETTVNQVFEIVNRGARSGPINWPVQFATLV